MLKANAHTYRFYILQFLHLRYHKQEIEQGEIWKFFCCDINLQKAKLVQFTVTYTFLFSFYEIQCNLKQTNAAPQLMAMYLGHRICISRWFKIRSHFIHQWVFFFRIRQSRILVVSLNISQQWTTKEWFSINCHHASITRRCTWKNCQPKRTVVIIKYLSYL